MFYGKGDTMISQAIKRIKVDKLFGTYNYDLSPSQDAEQPDRLMILYGDNGSGKTTILKTIFHILAPEKSQGHKTTLASIPFSYFRIEFVKGDYVWVARPEGKLTGSFTCGFRIGKHKEKTHEFEVNDEGRIEASPTREAFLRDIRGLNVALYFLSDDRTLRLAGLNQADDILDNDEDERTLSSEDLRRQLIRRTRTFEPEQLAQELLVQSLAKAGLWIQAQVVRNASLGESSVNTLYGEILNRIAKLPLQQPPLDTASDVVELRNRITRLEIRSREFSKYGLQPEFNGKEIMSIVSKARPTHISMVITVLAPYIESVEKKLDAMAKLQGQIDALVRLVNSFYTHKSITYEVHEGFKINAEDGKLLQPQMLSSGERHLLLLFCNTIQALDRPTIYFIDEPEISLNIKWQRRLLSALLECAGDNPIQYIFATHSFELLAQCKNNAIKLEDVAE
jgi:energy-coupling factor transporter ATP-binding protein EcfA2